ncbi:hypothetical protein [Pseudomonas aeruginosa]|uniref:hypothetical protein n=1 Tax=Pseudomonas aeruginosa TaxID=287 RepID=UPI000B2F1B2F|nr:hypothetical protein [Pseudomonas aeruginosa]MBG6542761.1 hypothetical protein [Pseudomonas aeruginosa]MEE2515720.1 hypothetical protein [Pseudomonas aeruginosa]
MRRVSIAWLPPFDNSQIPRERATSVPVIQSSMTSGADSSPAVVVHGGRRGLAQGGSYPALTLSGLVAMLPEVITRLTVDSSASSVAGGLEILGQVMEWQLRNRRLSVKRKASAKSMIRPSRGIACHTVTGP